MSKSFFKSRLIAFRSAKFWLRVPRRKMSAKHPKALAVGSLMNPISTGGELSRRNLATRNCPSSPSMVMDKN